MEPIFLSTPLEHIAFFKKLSKRTRNVCQRNRLLCLTDLMNLTPDEIQFLKGAGARTIAELSDFRATLAPMMPRMSEGILWDDISEELIPLRDVFKVARAAFGVILAGMDRYCVPVVRAWLEENEQRFILNCISGFMPDMPMDESDARIVRQILPQFFTELKQLMVCDFPSMIPALERCREMAESLCARNRTRDRYLSLPHIGRRLLANEYRKAFNEMLSVRAANVYAQLSDLDQAIDIVGSPELFEREYSTLGGRKSRGEFMDLLRVCKLDLESFFEQYNVHRNRGTETGFLRTRYLQVQYPFLSRSEIAALSRMGNPDEPAVLMRLARAYLLNDNDNPSRAFVLYFGLADDAQPVTQDEAAETLGITRERVRQLIVAGAKYPAEMQEVVDGLRATLTDVFIPHYSPFMTTFEVPGQDPSHALGPVRIMGILCSLAPEYKVERINGSPHSYMVRREYMSGFNIMEVYNKIVHLATVQQYEALELNLEDFLSDGAAPGSLHPEVMTVAPLFLDTLSRHPNITIREDGTICVARTKYDIVAEAVDVLRQEGAPLGLKDLYSRVQARCNGTVIPTERSFKAYIYNAPQIVAVGRRSTYGLTEWTHISTLSNTEHIHRALAEHQRPMTSRQLAEALRKELPDITPTRIAALIGGDQKGRFRSLGLGLYGLADLEYGEADVDAVGTERMAFADRFRHFRDFVHRHRRFPTFNGDNHEQTLNRWIRNVQAGRIRHSASEAEELRHFMEVNAHLPHNRSEVEFRDRCEEIARAAADGRLDEDMHRWIAHQRRKNLSGNRRAYLHHLTSDMDNGTAGAAYTSNLTLN